MRRTLFAVVYLSLGALLFHAAVAPSAAQQADEVVKYNTGEDSFFASQIAFAQPTGKSKEIAVMDWDGAGVHKVTSNGSQNLLPSWHPNGGSLLYTTFVRGTPDLFSISAGGG